MNYNPESRLRREEVARALTEAGFPIKPGTLATMASRGGGPPFSKFGVFAIYLLADALAWAQARSSGPARSTSEREAA